MGIDEDKFNQIKAEPQQLEMMAEIASIISKDVGIDVIVVKGFLWKGIKLWQVDNKKFLVELNQMTKSDRMDAMEQILIYAQDRMTFAIKTEESSLVNAAIKKALNFYKRKM
ncbi:MAG: hypothetical protein INQ03_20075 [Candidatus Heimdallarchaeota archaeon]|nr:hypothetical protein [Candidatus Heimdallarchaeota archaeon]